MRAADWSRAYAEAQKKSTVLVLILEGIPYVHPSGFNIYLFTLLHRIDEQKYDFLPPYTRETASYVRIYSVAHDLLSDCGAIGRQHATRAAAEVVSACHKNSTHGDCQGKVIVRSCAPPVCKPRRVLGARGVAFTPEDFSLCAKVGPQEPLRRPGNPLSADPMSETPSAEGRVRRAVSSQMRMLPKGSHSFK